MKPAELIILLELVPLPEEGGLYRETYRSKDSTAIYYLLTQEEFSAFHRIPQDEIFHFYMGDPAEMVMIDQTGNLEKLIIGPDIRSGHKLQIVVPGMTWQGLRLVEGGSWSLLGTTVAPPFKFEKFEVGNRKNLIAAYPQHREIINRYTRE